MVIDTMYACPEMIHTKAQGHQGTEEEKGD